MPDPGFVMWQPHDMTREDVVRQIEVTLFRPTMYMGDSTLMADLLRNALRHLKESA